MTVEATPCQGRPVAGVGAAPGGSPAPVKSLYKYSYLEALRYKWIASERAQSDLGNAAISEWLRLHWGGWCRARWLEHLMGIIYWSEFEEGAFGTLSRNLPCDPLILDRVLDRVRCGWENLDIILWAAEWKVNTDAVIDILVALDINRARLDPASLFTAE